jgi:hypothetical protein
MCREVGEDIEVFYDRQRLHSKQDVENTLLAQVSTMKFYPTLISSHMVGRNLSELYSLPIRSQTCFQEPSLLTLHDKFH